VDALTPSFDLLRTPELTLVLIAVAPQICAVSEAGDFKSLRRLALASLGRNVLHFQRLEAQLKLLTLFCDFQSPLKDVAANHKLQLARMKTLGGLVSELNTRLYGKPSDPKTTKEIAEAWLTVQFRVDADPKYIREQSRKLQDLVKERNRLIHHDLSDFDPSSAESCRRWITRLDEQNERIMERLKAVQQLVDQLREGFTKILEAMQTEERKRGLAGTAKRSKR
jgi:hypothetical protein